MKLINIILIGSLYFSLNVSAHPHHKHQVKNHDSFNSKGTINKRVSKTEKMQHRLTRCLGREELRIHKDEKENYHFYLNQTLISHLIGIEGATISDSIYYSVCNSKKRYPSLDLYMAFLKNGEKSFKILPNENISTRSSIKRFVTDLIGITNVFFLHTKKNAKNKKCLDKYTPELLAIETDLLYLLGEMEFSKILFRKNRMRNLIRKIRDPYFYQKRCPKNSKE